MEHYDSDEAPMPIKPKKPTWWAKLGGGSLLIAALVHVVLLIVGALWVYQVIFEAEKKVDFMPSGGGGGERGAQTNVQQKKRQQITPSTSVKRVFAEGATSSYAIPDPGDSFGEMSALSSLGGGSMGGGGLGSGMGQGFGKGDGLGAGTGGGVGKLFGLIPETMRNRCSKEDRLQRLKENGATSPAVYERAVEKGLRWIMSQQNSDGSWAQDHRPVGITGLCLLAYFGRCETPASEDFGESCLKGIVYLVDQGMKNNGKLATDTNEKTWPYEHAIATYALAEALIFCKEMKLAVPNLSEVTEKAGQLIIDNQHKKGGWGYSYSSADDAHVDTSLSGWHVQALKSCSHTPIQFKGMMPTINKALDYINGNQDESGGYGYMSKKQDNVRETGEYYSLTGKGMLANQMWGKGNSSEVRRAADYILKNSKFDYDGERADLYAHYYESQAMIQMGGKHWEEYNKMFSREVLKGQDSDGSWRKPGGGKRVLAASAAFTHSPVYRAALCTLMLEVYYRFLNTDGGGKRSSGI
jgi:hypothetical protein